MVLMIAGKEAADSLVSVIMPCYNRVSYVGEAVDSVLAQTYANWELIAVDDASTDGTFEALKTAERNDARIRVIRHPQNLRRPSIARNTGLAQARGEYICFLDSDDKYLPSRIEALVAVLQQRQECTVAFSDMLYMDAEGRTGERYLARFLADAQQYLQPAGGGQYLVSSNFFLFQSLKYSALQTNTCLIARNRLKDGYLIFNESLTIAEDKDLWIRLGMHGGLVYLDEPLALYRLHGSNITKQEVLVASDLARFTTMNRRRIEGFGDAATTSQLRSHEARVYANLGWTCRLAGMSVAAMRAYWHAFALRPSAHLGWALAKAWLPARNS